jgi:hypothetical protein
MGRIEEPRAIIYNSIIKIRQEHRDKLSLSNCRCVVVLTQRQTELLSEELGVGSASYNEILMLGQGRISEAHIGCVTLRRNENTSESVYTL